MDSSTSREIEQFLERLYDDHAAGIYRFYLGMFGRREDAEDAVQALWLKLAHRPEPILAAEDAKAYLWAIARNLLISRLRRRALERFFTPALVEPIAELLAAEEDAGRVSEARHDLARAVAQLRPRLRSVLLLVGIEGYTLEEAAALLAIPRGTAASRYHAATLKLREFLRQR